MRGLARPSLLTPYRAARVSDPLPPSLTPPLIRTMPSLLRALQRLLIVFFATVLLAACGDDGDTAAPAGGRANTQKYNAYVSASNQYTQLTSSYNQPTFADLHAALSRVLDGTYNFHRAASEWRNDTEQKLRSNLEAALALSGKQPGLDDAAQTLLAVLKKMEPLSKDLAYYGETKGYVADGGAKARTLAPQLLPLLEEAHYAMEAFDGALEAADQALMRRNMEEAKEGSLEKYRISTIYYGKRIVGQLHAAYADIMTRQAVPPAPALLEQLQADLQAFDANTQAYLAWVADKKSDAQWQCREKKRHMVDFLREARGLLQKFQQDNWSRWERTTHERWDKSVTEKFGGIVSDYNRGDVAC